MKKIIFLLAVIFTITTNLFGTIYITTNTTWNSSTTITDNIVVQASATFTIQNCTITFAPNTGITLEPETRLNLTNAVLTSTSAMWRGIEAIGNSIIPPSANRQTRVQMIGGIIQNAETGIVAAANANVNVGNEAQFINNKIGVYFQNAYLWGYTSDIQGSFQRTTFDANSSFTGTLNNFDTHIKAYTSGAITVKACTLKSAAPQTNLLINKGIDVTNTWLTVTEICQPLSLADPITGQCNSGYPTEFIGFTHAILATNTGYAPKLDIRFNYFENNLYGVKNNAISNCILYFNIFRLSAMGSYGAWISNATGYQIMENDFRNPYSYSSTTTGLYIQESEDAENQVYKNRFNNLWRGIHFAGKNSNQSGGNTTGVQALCNEFTTTYLDILVAGVVVNPPSIRAMQGSFTIPAGNLFTFPLVGICNFENQASFSILYFHGAGPRETPIPCGLVTPFLSIGSKDCPKGIVPKNIIIIDELAKYDEYNSEYEYWLNKLLTTEIGTEEYDVILSNVSYFSGLKDNHFNSIIAAAFCEEDMKIENLKYLFTYRGSYTDYLGLTEIYLSERNYDEAMVTLSKMYELFEVTKEQVLELKGLETYTLWLQQLEKEGKNIYELSDKEIAYLTNFVKTNTGRGAVFAENILCVLYNICIEKKELPSMVLPTLQIDDKALSDKIALFPNPTTGELRVTSGELQVTNIEVLDIHGRKLLSHTSNLTPHTSIDISHLQAGMYFVKITTGQGEIVKKIVKQ